MKNAHPLILRPATRWLLIALMMLAATPMFAPGTAVADDATVAVCNEANFDATLATVQSSGGGTITFDCAGTLTFSGQKTITSTVTIIGNGSVIFDGNDSTRLFVVNSGASLDLVNLTLQNGNSEEFGGAIHNRGALTIAASTFSGNVSQGTSVAFGGAIYNDGTATITASTFNGNSAVSGGAIRNSGSMLTVVASTFSNNSASANGGAIATAVGSTATIQASTLSGNNSTYGGALTNDASSLTVTASTFSGNSATDSGGVINAYSGTTTVRASILTNSLAGNNCVNTFGTLTSGGSNLSDDGSCGFTATGDQQGSGVTVDLGALADNGGPTETMLPAPDSDALDAADCGLSSPQDQRGADRPDAPSMTCDIGAVEVGATVSVQIIAVNPLSEAIEGSTATLNASAYGPAGAALDYDFDCDNDGNHETQGSGSGPTGTATCAFADDGSFTVGVEVCDASDSSNCDNGTTSVTVNNVVPVISSVSSSGPAVEGFPVTIIVTATDPAGENDPLQYEFDCDNDGTYETGPQASNSANCLFGDNGLFTVFVRVTDDDGGSATASTTVNVGNAPPSIVAVTNDGPVEEGSPVTITVTATDPAGANDPLTVRADCDRNGSFETVGTSTTVQCAFNDNGSFNFPIIVSDDDGSGTLSRVTVSVSNADPSVATPNVEFEPSDEGQQVRASTTFTDPGTDDTHTCTVDYDDGSGPQAGTVVGLVCFGPDHTYLDDDPSGTASDVYTVTITVTDDDDGIGSETGSHTVNNVDPVIDGIATNGPVSQGEPVEITVTASDVGVNDVLTYSFNCDNSGDYETAGVGNLGSCPLAPGAATSTIAVQVEDDDVGVATGSIDVGQTLSLCGNYFTGALALPSGNDCPTGTLMLTLPAAASTSLCINPYSGELNWSPGGSCSGASRTHVVPSDGPLNFCRSLYTGKLHYSWNGQCNSTEVPGVIPG